MNSKKKYRRFTSLIVLISSILLNIILAKYTYADVYAQQSNVKEFKTSAAGILKFRPSRLSLKPDVAEKKAIVVKSPVNSIFISYLVAPKYIHSFNAIKLRFIKNRLLNQTQIPLFLNNCAFLI
jgi:hypothetical protein